MPLSFVLQTSNSNPFNTLEITKTLSQKAIDYKKNIAGKFMLVEGAKIKSRVAGDVLLVVYSFLAEGFRDFQGIKGI